MKFGSVCSGIEAASVAWHPLGWKAAWLSEIEPFPSAVLAHHYPNVPNLGDMTTLPERILSGEVEAPDVFCGGTPCQAFSVAGLRNSLDDARGNLSLTFCEIANAIDIQRITTGMAPSVVFWENVPGVLSTKDNAFGCFLGALAGEDEPIIPSGSKWTNAGCVYGPQRAVAWRILDAQYFGVAQRRRRVFVVASARDGFDPAAVLFEFDGVRRDTAPSREARKEVTECAGTGAAFGGMSPVAGTLTANTGGMTRPAGNANELDFCVPTYAIQGSMIGRNDEAGPQGDGINEEVCFTQSCVDRHAVATPVITMAHGQGGAEIGFDRGPTLTCNHEAPIAAYSMITANTGANGLGVSVEISPTLDRAQPAAIAQPIAFQQTADCLTAAYGTKWNGNASATNGSLFAGHAMQVRRLTPVECERLQGFPDNYTAIPWRKKPVAECPDGPRYKALGNSWAVPVVRWIGTRIAKEIKNAHSEPTA